MTAHLCKYGCGITIIFLGKTEKAGSTGQFEVINGKVTSTEHTFSRCERILKGLDAIEKTKQEHGGGLDAFNLTT